MLPKSWPIRGGQGDAAGRLRQADVLCSIFPPPTHLSNDRAHTRFPITPPKPYSFPPAAAQTHRPRPQKTPGVGPLAERL